MRKIFIFCKATMLRHIKFLVLYISLCVFSGCLSLVMPYISGRFIDILLNAKNQNILINYCVLVMIIGLINIVIGYFVNRVCIKYQTLMAYEMNRDMIVHIQKLPFSYLRNKDTAYLNQQVNNDANVVLKFCINVIQNIIVNIISIIVPVIIIFVYNKLVLVIILISSVFYFASYQFGKKYIYIASYHTKEAQAHFFSSLYEQFSSIEFIKLYALEETFILRIKKHFHNLLSKILKQQKVTYSFTALENLVNICAQIALFLSGGSLVFKGQLTIGSFTVLASYYNIIMNSVRYFFNLGSQIQDACSSCERLKLLVEEREENYGTQVLTHISNIKLDKVEFYYKNNKVFNDFSLDIVEGKIYVITGKNGSGKTTLLNIINGLYIHEIKGKMYFNGIDVHDLNIPLIRRNKMAIVEQKNLLLVDSIYNNIDIYNENISKESIDEMAKILYLDGVIQNLENKYATEVTENSSNFSGGEKQKISLVRALVQKKNILLLDEPTSAMDDKSVKKFAEYLLSIKAHRIIIVVTHDIKIMDIADEIINLDSKQ